MAIITNQTITDYYNDLCNRWGYTSTDNMSTGYESVMPRLRQLSKEVWLKADDAGKVQIEEEVFNIYRSVNIIPIHYYNKKLKRAINLCYKHRDEGEDAVIPKNLRRAFDLVSGGSIQNFKPMNARAVWEYLCPVMFGRVLDFSSGYGGRMLGAMTSNMRYHYTGIDPNTKTYNGLVALGEMLNECNLGSGYEMNHMPSEDFDPEPGTYDAAFSSPPYFNLETYSDEDTQCMNRCNNLDAWFELYVEPTLKMIHKGLARESLYAVNIADYNFDKENFQIVDRWTQLSEKVGFKFEHTVKMMLNVRPGQGNNRQQNALKFEGIYVFSKK